MEWNVDVLILHRVCPLRADNNVSVRNPKKASKHEKQESKTRKHGWGFWKSTRSWENEGTSTSQKHDKKKCKEIRWWHTPSSKTWQSRNKTGEKVRKFGKQKRKEVGNERNAQSIQKSEMWDQSAPKFPSTNPCEFVGMQWWPLCNLKQSCGGSARFGGGGNLWQFILYQVIDFNNLVWFHPPSHHELRRVARELCKCHCNKLKSKPHAINP